jgi:hypothetical protein
MKQKEEAQKRAEVGLVKVLTHIDFHLVVGAIVHNQTMRQPYSMRLHRMTSYVGIISDIRIVEVCHSLLVAWSCRT